MNNKNYNSNNNKNYNNYYNKSYIKNNKKNYNNNYDTKIAARTSSSSFQTLTKSPSDSLVSELQTGGRLDSCPPLD